MTPRQTPKKPVIVHVQSEHPRGRAAAARLKRRAQTFLTAVGKGDVELSILLVGDRGMRRLNRTWRGEDVPTDVLSFPAAESAAAALLGDVVLSLDTAARVAQAERRPVAEELDRYLVHGILHLLGFDHEEPKDARRMASREDEILGSDGMVAAAAAEPPRKSRTKPKAKAKPAAKPKAKTKPAAKPRGSAKPAAKAKAKPKPRARAKQR